MLWMFWPSLFRMFWTCYILNVLTLFYFECFEPVILWIFWTCYNLNVLYNVCSVYNECLMADADFCLSGQTVGSSFSLTLKTRSYTVNIVILYTLNIVILYTLNIVKLYTVNIVILHTVNLVILYTVNIVILY